MSERGGGPARAQMGGAPLEKVRVMMEEAPAVEDMGRNKRGTEGSTRRMGFWSYYTRMMAHAAYTHMGRT